MEPASQIYYTLKAFQKIAFFLSLNNLNHNDDPISFTVASLGKYANR